jgi:hypothetical protein
MADLVLSDGKEITFDLSRMSIKEYRGLFDPQEDNDKSDETIARVGGMALDEFQALSFPDYRRVTAKFFARCREPLSDPNA